MHSGWYVLQHRRRRDLSRPKWHRFKHYEKCAEIPDRHADGIGACFKPENIVLDGVVEGFDSKIRLSQRRPYGLLDE